MTDPSANTIAGPPLSEALGSSSGPSYCVTCGEWPARPTPNGLRCQMCECRDYAAAHPVPLPKNREMLHDLASIGVSGAAEALLQNVAGEPQTPQDNH